MEATCKAALVVNVKLNANEAQILKTMVQNGPKNESEDCAKFRETLFNILPSFEELNLILSHQ